MLIEVLDVFERHGLHHRDDRHTGCAVGLLRDAALIYDAQEPSWTAVVGAVLMKDQVDLVAEMCRDAQAHVTAGLETCGECDRLHGDLCELHEIALARAAAYRTLAVRLGAQAT